MAPQDPGDRRTDTTLATAFGEFFELVSATTIPVAGRGRRISGPAHAVALSESTSRLHQELSATLGRIIETSGIAVAEFPPGVSLFHSDSPDGAWEAVPENAMVIKEVKIGGNGADAVLVAALDSANQVAAFPKEKWNGMQAQRPGADHQRWHVGDIITDEQLAHLENAERLLRLRFPSRSVMSQEMPGEEIQYVTLDQIAAIVPRTKRTLEKYVDAMPARRVKGGGGKPNEWVWSEVRPWLEQTFSRPLPARYPSPRR